LTLRVGEENSAPICLLFKQYGAIRFWDQLATHVRPDCIQDPKGRLTRYSAMHSTNIQIVRIRYVHRQYKFCDEKLVRHVLAHADIEPD
jgi:hypothetical protein